MQRHAQMNMKATIIHWALRSARLGTGRLDSRIGTAALIKIIDSRMSFAMTTTQPGRCRLRDQPPLVSARPIRQ